MIGVRADCGRWVRVLVMVVAVMVVVMAALTIDRRSLQAGEPGLSAQSAVVSVIPGEFSLDGSQEITVTIHVDDVAGMYGADVRLAFSPQYLEVLDADPETDGVQIQPLDDFLVPDWILRSEADNLQGTVWYAATQLNPAVPVTGTGALAAIAFRGRAAGSTPIEVTYHKLARRDGSQIEAQAQDAAVTLLIDGQTATPGATPTRRATQFVTPMYTPTSLPQRTRQPTGTATPKIVEWFAYLPFNTR